MPGAGDGPPDGRGDAVVRARRCSVPGMTWSSAPVMTSVGAAIRGSGRRCRGQRGRDLRGVAGWSWTSRLFLATNAATRSGSASAWNAFGASAAIRCDQSSVAIANARPVSRGMPGGVGDAGVGAAEHEAAHALGRVDRQLLGDHPAQRHAEDVGPFDVEVVQQADRVVGELPWCTAPE